MTADFDEVARTLSAAANGWAEFSMQMTGTTAARVLVNAQAVRYVRAA